MLVAVIYFTVIIIVLMYFVSKISSDLDEDTFLIKIISFLIGILFVVDLYFFIEFVNPSITPMDVYSGKTTLEYTIVDGIKMDSCVVWKIGIER